MTDELITTTTTFKFGNSTYTSKVESGVYSAKAFFYKDDELITVEEYFGAEKVFLHEREQKLSKTGNSM